MRCGRRGRGNSLMEQYQGKTIYNKIAIGKVFLYQKKETLVKRKHIEDAEAEIARFDAAKETALTQLDQIYAKALKEVGADNAAVFEVHKMMMEDEDYLDSIYNMIRGELINAEYAVATTGDNFAEMFAQMDDAYMQARGGCKGHFRASGRGALRQQYRYACSERTGHPDGGRPGAKRNGADGQVKDSVLRYPSWLFQFPHSHPGPHDEHSRCNRH